MPTTLRTVLFAAAATAAAVAMATNAAAQDVTLRTSIETAGTAVTLGDLFIDAGPMSGRAVGPAPTPGRTATFSPRFVQAAASAAGLQWAPPQGMTTILVTGRGGDRVASTRAVNADGARYERTAAPSGDIAVRRGEVLTLVYVAPGMQLTTRARAMGDAAIGDPIRVVNLQSNRTVEATVTGAGAASANMN